MKGEVAASVIVEVVDLAEEDKEDIRLSHNPPLPTTAKYIQNSGGLLAKPRITDNPIAEERGRYEYICG